MRAIIVFLLIWLVGLDSFKLTQIIENAEEEIMQEIEDYNARKQPTSFYKSRKVTKEYVSWFIIAIFFLQKYFYWILIGHKVLDVLNLSKFH